MTNETQHNGRIKNRKTHLNEQLSPDGLWRSYRKVPHLLCYVKSGMFYGRVKVRGKIIRHSLETDVFTTAKIKLGDFLKKERTRKSVPGTFSQAREAYEVDLSSSHQIAENSKRYRRYCIQKLLESWPELDAMQLEDIKSEPCKIWSARLSPEVDETYFNNILGTFRAILKKGGVTDDPTVEVSRLGDVPKVMRLPESDQFEKLVEIVTNAGSRHSKNCADFIRFLAFSGCRLSEARRVTWADVDLERGQITVHRAKRKRTSNASVLREIPIIADMAALLDKLKASSPQSTDKVCAVGECEKSLTNACKRAGIARITHHDLRHLFATKCIESGVDIPTVSRWLGHSDGGALAMRVYGHLRTAHSNEMAKLVTFSKSP